MSSTNTHLSDVRQRPAWMTGWERTRHRQLHWFVECFAEFLGVFFYVYAGVGSTASFVIRTQSGQPGLGSLLQIGFGYAFGILLAIVVCGPTSGGHFNPCVTISFALFKGFPWRKVPRYIVAQVLGAFVAGLIIHAQWADLINDINLLMEAKGTLAATQFTPNGTGGIIALYVSPGSNLGRVFLNEFITDMFLALAIWTCLDPTNLFIPPAAAPWAISFAYAAAIWGYAPVGLSANAARDVGCRLAVMAIYGMKASGGTYAAISALTNIPATILAVFLYELFLADSDRVIPLAQMEFIRVHSGHKRLGHLHAIPEKVHTGPEESDDGKGHSSTYENAQSA